MKIASLQGIYDLARQKSAKLGTQNGKSLPSDAQQAHEARSVDIKNMGLNELNALNQATGDERLLFRLPYDTFRLVNGEYQGSQSNDFLSQIEDEITFERSLGNKTTELDSFLAALKNYQGYPLQTSIDTKA